MTLLKKENKENYLDEELAKGINIPRPLLRVIRLKCLDCCCGSNNEVMNCTCEKTCFLYPYRMGKNPFKKRILTEEQKQELRDRFKNNIKKEK